MADDSIRVKFNIDTANLPSQMQRIVNSIKKAEGEVERLRAKMDTLKDQQIPSHEYKKLQAELDAAIKKYEELNDTVETFNRIGTDKKSPHYQRAIGEAQDLYMKIEEIRGAMFELEEGGKAFTLGGDSEEYAKMAARVDELSGSIQVNKTRLTELHAKQKPIAKEFDKVKDKAEKAFSSINRHSRRSGNFIQKFFHRVSGLAKRVFIFSIITRFFRSIINSAKEAFTAIANYDNSFATSLQNLKNQWKTLWNQFAATFAPVAQAILNGLTRIVSAISTAMSYVAQFIALLGGKSTFTRAKQIQDSYNKSLDGTASSAKKAAGALAKFDDLDVLQKKEDDGGNGEGSANDMFEEVPIDPRLQKWLDGILERLKPILDYLKKLKDAFMDGFWDGLGDWGYRLDIIKEGLKQIMDALIDIWTDPVVLAAADRWAQSVMYMLGSLVGSVASIAITLAAAFIGGLGKYLSENTDRIKQFLISAFNVGTEINNLLAGLFQSIAYIFEGLASESGIRFVAALIGSILDAGMGIIEVALKLGRDILECIIQPITENKEGFRTAFEGLLSSAATVLEGLKESIDRIFDKINQVYDEHFKPFFDAVANGLSEIVGVFLEVWNGKIQPILDRLSRHLSTLMTDYLTPLGEKMLDVIGTIMDVLTALWTNVLQPLIEWLIANVFPVIAEWFSNIVDTIMFFIEVFTIVAQQILEWINSILEAVVNFVENWQVYWEMAGALFEVFRKLIDVTIKTIKDLFSGLFKSVKMLIDGDWKGAWENAKKVFETFKERVSSIIDRVKQILEPFFEWASNTISSILESLSNIGSKIKGAFSGVFGGGRTAGISLSSLDVPIVKVPVAVDIPSAQIDNFNIPHLASGSVIQGGRPFPAILGDQPRGQVNIEAPLNTIRQAVREELSGMQYGGGISPVISLNIDGSEFARLTLNDILSEAARQGYDVSVLGVT